MQTSSDYDHLMLMQKVEVFEQAIEHTSGDDLAKVLWLKSPSSEVREREVDYVNLYLVGDCLWHVKAPFCWSIQLNCWQDVFLLHVV